MDRARKQHKVNFSWKKSFKIAVLFFTLVFSICSLSKARHVEYFPIKDVKIFGVNRVDHQAVETLVSPMVSKGFFAVDVDRIKEQVLQLAWVADVEVRRVWPEQVIITVSEKIPVALWNDVSLLSTSGDLFSPPTESYPTDLPAFAGPAGEQLLMAKFYAKMSMLLMPLNFKITRLELTPAMAWSIILDNGIKLNIGHKDVLTRLSHFVKVYPKIVGDRVADVEYVDLRYPNGMAVRWKSVT